MRWNLTAKLILAYLGGIALMTGSLSAGIYWQLQRFQRAALQERLLGVVSLAAKQINGEYHSLINRPEDTDSAYYIANQQHLNEIQSAEPDIVRLYTLRFRDGHYRIVLNHLPEHDVLTQSSARVGDVLSDLPYLLKQQTTIETPITEKDIRINPEGQIVLYGYAPVQGELGHSDSILVIEMDATSIGQSAIRFLSISAGIFGMMLLISLPLVWWLARLLVIRTNPHFSSTARQLADSQWDAILPPINCSDEQGQLMSSSDHINLHLQTSFKELQDYSQNLEQTVKDRTKEISETQQLLDLVINNIPQSIFWKNRDNRYLGCNQSFAQAAGMEPQQIIGKTDYDMPWTTEETNFYIECDRRVMESKTPEFGIVEPISKADGKQGWLETNKIPFENLEGDVIGVVGIFQDITHYKEAEEAAYQANRTKSEFLANMSHELRTPLNAILGLTEGLQEQIFGVTNERQNQALKTVRSSGNHLLELINDILDLSKIESGHVELDYSPTDIVSLCTESLTFIKEQALKKNIQLKTKLPNTSPLLLIDERRIRQVLINLLDNAIKFTPDGGCVTLAATLGSPIFIPNQTNSKPSTIKISVIDTGIGIVPEDVPQLFQPFIQIDSALNRQYSGTGLGLALAKRIVKLHGGEIQVTSQVGAGSCFSITLPCIGETQTMPIPESMPESTIQHPTHLSDRAPLILLAEDNEANSNTLSYYLQAKGYCLIIAKDGEEAISLSQSHRPDLIVMDIQMPNMDGLAATRHIRHDAALANIPIIALTALAMKGDQERCLAAGATNYLSKPVRLKQLVQLIEQLLN